MDTFVHLSRLENLTELKLQTVNVDQDTPEQAQHVTVLGVRKLEFRNIGSIGTDPSSVTICRLISSLFPNVTQLTLSFDDWVRIV